MCSMLKEEYSPESEKYVNVRELLYLNLLQHFVLTHIYDTQADSVASKTFNVS